MHIALDELQTVAHGYVIARGQGDRIRTTLTGETHRTERQDGRVEHWYVAEEQVVEGYGSNHMPEKSYWQFGVVDGRQIGVIDSMHEEQMDDLLEEGVLV